MPARWRNQAEAQRERRGSDNADVESAVFAYIVGERPKGVTVPMLALRFNDEFDQGIDGSAVERAVRELVRDGRLQMQGGRVIPVQLVEPPTATRPDFRA